MKTLLIFSLLLLTSCSYFKKQQQEHIYNFRATDANGNNLANEADYMTIIERTKDWIVLEHVNGWGTYIDTLFIKEGKNLEGKISDFRVNQTHVFKFTGKIIDESFKTLRIKGEYFDYNQWTKEYYYYGIIEIY